MLRYNDLVLETDEDSIMGLGDLTVNPGSLHLYQRHYEDASEWMIDNFYSPEAKKSVERLSLIHI